VALLVGRGFMRLWKAGLIGVAIMVVVDYFATRYILYAYPGGIVYLSNIPIFLIILVYATSILYLNWLPVRWVQRFLYTIYFAALFLALEAVMYSAGAIAYPRWQLWYSYPLLLGGLSLFAYLSDFVLSTDKRGKNFFSENKV
jgi:hypothetical protein